MPIKHTASKRAWKDDAPPISEPRFKHGEQKTRYALLAQKPIGKVQRIDWNVLKTLFLDRTILEHISHDGWDKVFDINEPTYYELTLEVLTIIEVVKLCNFF